MVKIDSIEDVKKLLNNQHESQNQIQVGYGGETTDRPIRKVGDKWTDSDGNEWEQKEGYSMKLGKEWQQELHQYLNSFPKCPKETCTCAMPKRMDEKMKMIHGMCFDCVIDMEAVIKKEGRWEEYTNGILNSNKNATLEDIEKAIDSWFVEKADSFVSENGEVENWAGGDKTKVYEEIKKELEKAKAFKI